MDIQNVMKMVGRKYPTCTVIDSTEDTDNDISAKCGCQPFTKIVGTKKESYEVTLCTGSFNVYIIGVKEPDAE